jgi:hypothetical protein
MPRPRATHQEIQKWVFLHHGFMPESCWIAHCKQLFVGVVFSGDRPSFDNPCPPNKQPAIKQAFRYFGILPADDESIIASDE